MPEILEGPSAIAVGVDRLTQAKLVCFPTETVYGLGADAFSAQAVERVFALKGRPSTNPLIVHVSGIEMAKAVVSDWPESAQLIAKAHWPGPVTIVLPKADCVPDIVCAGGETVAVRCPAHPCALALIESFVKPIVGPSANPSGGISPTTPEHVADGFPDADLIIIDGGHCRAGIESTVIDLSTNTAIILRPGIIGAHTLSQTLGREVLCQTNPNSNPALDPIARSPGVLGAHYQPKTPTKLVDTDQLDRADGSITLISWSLDTHPAGPTPIATLILMPSQPEPYASAIYRALHQADASNATQIWIEHPPLGQTPDERAIHSAILERLARATHS